MYGDQGTAKECSKSLTPNKERIIPIEIEGDEKKIPTTRSSTRLQTKNRENKVISKLNQDLMDKSDEPEESFINSTETSDNEIKVDPEILPERPIPPIYIPEKIIIILDSSLDDNCTNFELNSGKKYTPLSMLQNAIQIFLYNKSSLSSDHEFALMILNDNSATWVHEFTNAPQDIIASLQLVKPCKPEDILNLNTVFDLICKYVYLPTVTNIAVPFVVRAIMLYNRSYSIPVLTETPKIMDLLRSPFFTFDVIMTHEPPGTENHCDKIFETLQRIDPKGFAYAFSVSRNSKDLHIAMGKVLSHSLQRPPQSVINYDITQFKM